MQIENNKCECVGGCLEECDMYVWQWELKKIVIYLDYGFLGFKFQFYF